MIVLLIVMTGLMAGIYFTFSVVVMKSLGQLPAAEGARVMIRINDVILNTVFMPLFFGSTLWFGGLILWSFADWQEGRSMMEVTAALIYIIGMFLVTAFGNLPLNNQLKESEDNEPELVTTWNIYLVRWTQLNHFRTLSCIAACIVLVMAQR